MDTLQQPQRIVITALQEELDQVSQQIDMMQEKLNTLNVLLPETTAAKNAANSAASAANTAAAYANTQAARAENLVNVLQQQESQWFDIIVEDNDNMYAITSDNMTKELLPIYYEYPTGNLYRK